jgi:integrase
MTATMPHKLPRFVHREINRHGNPRWYFRRGHAPRIRLPDEYGTAEWFTAYDKALGGDRARKPRYADGSFAWGLAAYYKSQAWAALGPATQRQRRNVFKHIEAQHGAIMLTQWTRREIVAGRDKRADRPAASGMFIKAMRGLFQWLLDAEHIKVDPTQGVKLVETRTDGFEAWTIDDLAAYRAQWPLGTRQRVAVEVIFAGGFRRGDAVRVGRQHVRDGVIRIDTEKTGERVVVPVSDTLDAALKAGPTGDLAFIVSAEGKPYVKESFGNNFRDWCTAAKITKSAHGLRKLAATLDAEAGYTGAELGAKYGWADLKMPSLYTRSADRERLSLNAAARVKKQDESANKKSRT